MNGYSEIDPPVKVGNQILEILRVLDYAAEAYRLSLLEKPTQIPINVSPPEPTESFELAFTLLLISKVCLMWLMTLQKMIPC